MITGESYVPWLTCTVNLPPGVLDRFLARLAQPKPLDDEFRNRTREAMVNLRRRADEVFRRDRSQARRLLRRVAWANRKQIAKFYALCPKGRVVDHIIPLQGRKVSGLHVLANLQYLTKAQNARKHNMFDVPPSRWQRKKDGQCST